MGHFKKLTRDEISNRKFFWEKREKLELFEFKAFHKIYIFHHILDMPRYPKYFILVCQRRSDVELSQVSSTWASQGSTKELLKVISLNLIRWRLNSKIRQSHKSYQRIQYQDTVSSFPVIMRSEPTPWNKTIPLIMINAAKLALCLTPFVKTSYFWILFHNRIAWLKISFELKAYFFHLIRVGHGEHTVCWAYIMMSIQYAAY